MARKHLLGLLALTAWVNSAISADQAPASGNYQVQFPDVSKIQDQPVEVQVPKGLPPLTPNAVVPASNPLTAGNSFISIHVFRPTVL